MIEYCVRTICCPKGRCSNCRDSSDLGCMSLLALQGDSSNGRVLLVEADRKLIHFISLKDEKLLQPPWQQDGWETAHVSMDTKLMTAPQRLIDVYSVGPYISAFFVKPGANYVIHENYPFVRTSLELALVDELVRDMSKITDGKPAIRTDLSDRLQQLASCVSQRISETLPEINEITRDRISVIVANRSTVLNPLIPILLDDDVEEVYLDKPLTPVYFDHVRHGRCTSSAIFDCGSVSRLVTLFRAESNLHLDRRNPSLKTDLNILGSSLRVSVSTPPLTPDGFHLEIRRARQEPFSIPDLIENGTLPIEAAAVLLLAISCRFNITITGEPGSGKTTLLNALDLSSPRSWRKLYIEDAIESRSQREHHQIRIRVDPVDEVEHRFDKTSEIIKSLHRSPDYMILGEIQTIEHSRALFQALAAGLRTIQTCHSFSAASLLARWTHGHGIENSSLALGDVIVTLRRPVPGESTRLVSEIVEIRKDVVNGFLEFRGLNTVYSSNEPSSITWSEDGAFQFHAKQAGSVSHFPAYKAIIEDLREQVLCTSDSNEFKLSEKLWGFGHPMKYVGR